MALYKDRTILTHSDDAEFDKDRKPGTAAPFSGIYRCKTCGHEVASEEGNRLPPQHEKPHNGPIIWRLVVFAEHKT